MEIILLYCTSAGESAYSVEVRQEFVPMNPRTVLLYLNRRECLCYGGKFVIMYLNRRECLYNRGKFVINVPQQERVPMLWG